MSQTLCHKKSKQKFKCDEAAGKALKQVSSMEMLEQLDLFETVLHLYSTEGGLTSLEYQQLQNVHTVELRRKSLLLTSIIPGKGLYRGMRMLRRALKKTGQRPILNKLDKAYEGAVDELIAKNLRIRQGPWSNETTGADQSSQVIPRVDSVATASCSSVCHASITSEHLSLNMYRDGGIHEDSCNTTASRERTPSGNMSRRSITTSSGDDDGGILLDTIVQKQQQPTSLCIPSFEVNIQFRMSEDLSRNRLPSVQLTPYRQRSGHISHQSNPYIYKVPERAKSSAPSALVNEIFEEEQLLSQMSTEKSMREDNNKIGTLTSLHSINQLECESLVLKFVIVGDSSTGKTSLLYRYVSGKFSIVYDPTTLVDFQSAELECYNKKYKLHLWDTAGQERFKAVTTAYYRDAVGAFVVYDVTDMRSLEHSSQWKKEIDDVVRLVNGDPIPVVLIANKMDCGHLDGEQFSKDHGFVGYFETSAKTGQGIQAAVHFLVKKVHGLSCVHKEPVVQTLYRNRSTSIMLHFNNDSKEKKCCKN